MITIGVPKTKRITIITSIQDCLISWINVNYREYGERKAFPTNLMLQYRVSQSGDHDCNAHDKKNRDYYEYPSLAYFTNKP